MRSAVRRKLLPKHNLPNSGFCPFLRGSGPISAAQELLRERRTNVAAPQPGLEPLEGGIHDKRR
jgi:hypothetical protein